MHSTRVNIYGGFHSVNFHTETTIHNILFLTSKGFWWISAFWSVSLHKLETIGFQKPAFWYILIRNIRNLWMFNSSLVCLIHSDPIATSGYRIIVIGAPYPTCGGLGGLLTVGINGHTHLQPQLQPHENPLWHQSWHQWSRTMMMNKKNVPNPKNN